MRRNSIADMKWRRDFVRDSLVVASAVAVLARVGVFIGSIVWPIPNERGDLVSPLLPQRFLDYQFYLNSLARYASSWSSIFDQFVQFYRDPLANNVTTLISGPVFPFLLGVSGFAAGNYLPLSVFYVALCSVLAVVWLLWLHRSGVGGLWLIAFALIPNPIWFTLVVSPDLIFAAEFAAFFIAYFGRQSRTRTVIWVIALVLMILTRPNSFSIALFVALDAAWLLISGRRTAPMPAIGLFGLLVVSGLYLFPYFLFEMGKAGAELRYFGVTPLQYLSGLFHWLPTWLDLAASWLALLGAKLLYFTGLRPTYGVTPLPFVLLRAAPGLVLLPGLIWMMFTAPTRQRALIALYCLPFVLGPAQDRYYIAVYPVLFLYGVRAWGAAGRALRHVVASRPAAQVGPGASID